MTEELKFLIKLSLIEKDKKKVDNMEQRGNNVFSN